jgi:hypothetical protein
MRGAQDQFTSWELGGQCATRFAGGIQPMGACALD